MKKRFFQDEKGSIALILAMGMTAFLTMSALVVDFGSAYLNGSNLQTAADAAVMAAGVMLPVADADGAKKQKITKVIEEYINKNENTEGAQREVYFDGLEGGKYKKVGVKIENQVPTSFARIIGVNYIHVAKEAEAQVVVGITVRDAIPLSVTKENLENCLNDGKRHHITLKYGAGDGTTGSFGAIDLDGVKGGGANDYTNWLANGFEGELTIGEKLYPVESGNMAGPTSAGFTSRYNSCTHFQAQGGCALDQYVPYCQRVVKVPVIEYVNSKTVDIIGFAAFVLEDTIAGKNNGYVTGSYVDMVNIGSYGGDPTGTAQEYGVYSVMLSK